MIQPSQELISEMNELKDKSKKFVVQGLRTNKNKTFAINLMHSIYNQIDSKITQIQNQSALKPDCKRGCDHCCLLRVEALPAEIFIIARELRKLPKIDFDALLAQLGNHSEKAKGVTMEDYRMPCPLLKNGSCSVYSLRPSMCRKFFSLDVEQCKIHGANIPEDPEVYFKLAGMIVGANNGYGHYKIPNYSHELGQALLIALNDEKIEDKWFSGEVVFPMLPEQNSM